MRIVADENIAFAREFFAPLGELVLLPGRLITAADIAAADVLLVRSVTPVNAALLADSRVRFVGSCTIGTDHVDTAWLDAHSIAFAHAPGCNARAVVEYVLSSLLALGVDMLASRIGVVGCGNVGGQLLRCLQQAGAQVVGCDPFLKDTALPLVPFEQVLTREVICLHTPLTRSGPHPTFHLFDEAVIASLSPGTVLLNAGRGAVIDNAALLRRLQQRSDLRVVLDVWENEPAIDGGLLDQVAIGTPHIAGYSAEGKLRGTRMVYEALCRFLGVDPADVAVGLAGIVEPYDVGVDDAALRQAYPASGAQGFDRLRRDYRARRECPVPVGRVTL